MSIFDMHAAVIRDYRRYVQSFLSIADPNIRAFVDAELEKGDRFWPEPLVQLNPAYREDELDFYLKDIKAKAILVMAEESGAAVAIAHHLKIAVLRIIPDPKAPAGTYTIEGPTAHAPVKPRMAEPNDTALLLHTSGTTSRPKLVPLSHANLAASARNIGAALALTAADRCLNIMPLFHIHGLIAAVRASLAAGGSVTCTPGFNALRFFTWLNDAGATWYTAVQIGRAHV